MLGLLGLVIAWLAVCLVDGFGFALCILSGLLACFLRFPPPNSVEKPHQPSLTCLPLTYNAILGGSADFECPPLAPHSIASHACVSEV